MGQGTGDAHSLGLTAGPPARPPRPLGSRAQGDPLRPPRQAHGPRQQPVGLAVHCLLMPGVVPGAPKVPPEVVFP